MFKHRNSIDDFDQLEYLALCPNLKVLTVSSNPITTTDNMRDSILKILPALEYLDDKPAVDGPTTTINSNPRPASARLLSNIGSKPTAPQGPSKRPLQFSRRCITPTGTTRDFKGTFTVLIKGMLILV